MYKENIDQLERRLGDPTDASSSISFARSLDYDALEAFPDDAAQVLRELRYCEYYVPTALGGRFDRVDELLYALRAISRRDLTLAIGHAVTMLGAISVWVGGTPQQRKACATIVLADRPMSFALTEFAHGSDLLASDCCVTELPGGLELNGEKWLINNATRGAALCVYAHHVEHNGVRGSMILFLDKSELPLGTWEATPKIPTVGIRGADISGIRFTRTRLDKRHVVGRVGQGLELVWRGLQITRTLCSGLSLGAADTGIRLAVLNARKIPAADRPSAMQALASMCETMLGAEAVALCATRLAHVAPQELSLASAVAKYFVPTEVEAVFRLAQWSLGPCAAQTNDTFLVYEKFARDQRLVSLFEGSTVVSLQMIAMQLKSIAKLALNSQLAPLVSAAHTLFCVDASLPPLDFERLTITVRGNDTVCGFGLFELPERLRQTMGLDHLVAVLDDGATRLKSLYDDINARSADRSMQAPFWFEAARIYCDLFAMAALASFWYCNRDNASVLTHPLFRDTRLLSEALRRRLVRDATVPSDSAAHYEQWVNERIRHQEAISLRPLAAPFAETEGDFGVTTRRAL